MTSDVLVLVNSEYEDTPYDTWAGDDVRLHLLVAEEKAAGYAHLPRVQSFPDYRTNGNVERTALELARRVRFDAVVARAEPDVLRAGRLRQLLGTPGQDFASARAFRDKHVMKQLVDAAGIAVPAFAPVDSALDVLAFVDRYGLPVVVKPRLGSGSLGVTVVRTRADLESLLTSGVEDRGLLVEAFVPGEMYVVDGLVVNSRIVTVHPSRYLNDCLSFQRGEFLGNRLLAADNPLRPGLERFAEGVLDALPTPEVTTFHLEVFVSPAGELVFCEIASRTGGARINQTLDCIRGVNLDRLWFDAQLGRPVEAHALRGEPDPRLGGHLLLYPGVGRLCRLPSRPPQPYVLAQRLGGQVGDRHSGGYKSGDFLAAYVVAGPSETAVDARLHELSCWFDREVEYEL